MIRDQQRLTKQRLAVAPREWFEQIPFLVFENANELRKVLIYAFDRSLPFALALWSRRGRPVVVRPLLFHVVFVAAKEQDVGLRDPQVLQQFPRGVRRTLWASTGLRDRELLDGIRERDVRVAIFEKGDQMFSQVRIGAKFSHAMTSNIKAARMPPLVEIRDVSYSVGGRAILHDIRVRVDEGETLVLLGRSGSGKTTLLKTINRLITPTAGDVRFEGRSVLEWDPIQLRRRIGYVIQEGGLFPHVTVEGNVGMVPKLEGWAEPKIRSRVQELLETLGLPLSKYGARFPSQLSGGEKQRVGIARALAADPPMLLLDEPFAALDPVTRFEAQQQFLQLRRSLRKTAIFVTHDIREALMLGTRIALLKDGRIDVIAPAEEFTAARTPEAQAFLKTLEESETRCPAD